MLCSVAPARFHHNDAMLSYAMLSYAMLSYAMLSSAMLCYASVHAGFCESDGGEAAAGGGGAITRL